MVKILPGEFDGQSIRRLYDETTDTWWFSVIDIIEVLTASSNAKRYWSDLKRKLAQEAGSEQPYEKIVRFKLPAKDGTPTAPPLQPCCVWFNPSPAVTRCRWSHPSSPDEA
ncbi:MAG: hypothetical protein RBR77_15250 [Thauera sp.]|nr:hypothetical protein [Thauera sp.]